MYSLSDLDWYSHVTRCFPSIEWIVRWGGGRGWSFSWRYHIASIEYINSSQSANCINVLEVVKLIKNEILSAEERDEYDDEFDKMREANLKTRAVQAKEEHGDALKTVDEWRGKLAHAKEQVNMTAWFVNLTWKFVL